MNTPLSPESGKPVRGDLAALTRRHLQFGWWLIALFLSMGLVLEGLHGLKVGFYLDVSNQTRRLMWTLAHAHGTLLGLVNVAFAVTLPLIPQWPERTRAFASVCLIGASLLIPTGFFLGGTVVHGGDPSLGVLLVPLGALLLLLAAALTIRAFRGAKAPSGAAASAAPAPRKKPMAKA